MKTGKETRHRRKITKTVEQFQGKRRDKTLNEEQKEKMKKGMTLVLDVAGGKKRKTELVSSKCQNMTGKKPAFVNVHYSNCSVCCL